MCRKGGTGRGELAGTRGKRTVALHTALRPDSVRARTVTADRLLERAKWGVFAVAADDHRRRRYARWLAALHRRQVVARRLAVAGLPAPPEAVDPGAGFVMVAPDAPWDLVGVADQVRELVKGMTPPDAAGGAKPYLLDFRLDVLAADSPLARLALNPAVVATAAAHLGMVPLLAGVTVLRSPYVAGPPSGSQLFHSDWEDVSQLKLFVHCSDVSSRNGPLTALRAPASARAKQAMRYRYGGSGFRRGDDEVLALVDSDEIRAFEGPAGTAVFVDTSACLHYGSRLSAGAPDRLVVQLQFLRPTAFSLVLRRDALPVVAGPRPREAWAALVAPGGSR